MFGFVRLTGAALLAAGAAGGAPPVSAPPGSRMIDVALAGGADGAGPGSIALVMGASGVPLPQPISVETLLTALYQSGGIDAPHPSSLLEVLAAIIHDFTGQGL